MNLFLYDFTVVNNVNVSTRTNTNRERERERECFNETKKMYMETGLAICMIMYCAKKQII